MVTSSNAWLLRAAVAIVTAAALAACGGGGPGPADGGRRLEVTGTDGLQFEPSRLTAGAGEVLVELTAEQAINHNFTIEELGDREVVEAAAGETETGTIELEPGTYTFYCSVPGHRAAGMEGTLTVE